MPPLNYPSKTSVPLLALKLDDIQLSNEEIQKVIDKDGTILYNIGDQYYRKGKYSNALIWFLKAAAQKHSDAHIMVGHMYYHGKGVCQSYELAKQWYLKTIHNNGDRNAQYFLGELYRLGQGVTKNVFTAVDWFAKSAEQDNVNAQYRLGYIYENEEELKNLNLAMKWYKIADYNGYEATNDINRLITKGCSFDDGEKEEESDKVPSFDFPLFYGEELNDVLLDSDHDNEMESFLKNSQQANSQATSFTGLSDEHEDNNIENEKLQQRLGTFKQMKIETNELTTTPDNMESDNIEKSSLEGRLETLERNKVEMGTLLQVALNSIEQDKGKLESEIQQLQHAFDQFKLSSVKDSHNDSVFY